MCFVIGGVKCSNSVNCVDHVSATVKVNAVHCGVDNGQCTVAEVLTILLSIVKSRSVINHEQKIRQQAAKQLQREVLTSILMPIQQEVKLKSLCTKCPVPRESNLGRFRVR